jgi:glucose-6-phosphate isomerase
VNRDGEFIDYKTMASLWGQPGSNAQHSIFQWLHQGTEKAQTDFIGIAQQEGDTELQQMLLSNLFAQIDTLAHGKSFEDALSEISDSELSESAKIKLARQKTFPGNKPNNLILIKELNPRNIGSLLAMFEHKVFVLGFLWNINSFDQFGVELGKTIAKEKLETIKKIPTLDFETIVQNLKQGTL